MAKKEANLTEENVVEKETKETKATKSDVKNKDNKKVNKSKKSKTDKRGLGKRIKETTSELKKVSWPTFGKVVKSTLVVLVVVIFFTIVLFGIDYLLKFPFDLLTNNG